MAIREDEWLSGVFGHSVFAVDADAAGDVERHAGEQQRAFYFAKVPVEQTKDVAALSKAGFAVVDVNVTLARDTAPPEGDAALNVAPARPEDGARVLDIAGSCFRYSRFHLDPAIARETANAVKREWVASYVAGRRGVELLVARDGTDPVGFLAVLEDGRARVIDLIGVAPERQGRGVGAALVTTFIQRHAHDADELRVGTQIANVASLRLYARCGFEIDRSAFVLHLHVGNDA